MGTLYNITEEQLRLNDMLEAAEGELTPELEEALAINADNFKSKAAGYSATIMDARARIKALADEIKRLQRMKNVEQRKVEILSERLSDALKLFGIDHMNVDKYRLSFRRSSSVNITDACAVPERFIQRTATFDKAAIKEAMKNGETVDGAEMTEIQNLQIR